MNNRYSKETIFLSYYGDDFTGSTDVMESLHFHGIPTALFLQAPSPERLSAFRLKRPYRNGGGGLKAFGVAGVSRSMSPDEMERKLPPVFELIAKIPADFFHYKVCSTFDSSPEIGSIGKAVSLAQKYFQHQLVPLVVGAPFLNRMVVFGNLFARVEKETFRLDRHPTMSKHPVTPMEESDLRQHLALQSKQKVGLLDTLAIDRNYGDPERHIDTLKLGRGDFLLFDTYSDEQLGEIGKILFSLKSRGAQLLVGSSGVEHALRTHLNQSGQLSKPTDKFIAGKADQFMVMAGSCSPMTFQQVHHMKKLGAGLIKIDTLRLAHDEQRRREIDKNIRMGLEMISNNQPPVFYSADGPEDPVIRDTKKILRQSDQSLSAISEAQGEIVRAMVEHVAGLRVAVAGGDTSGYVARALKIEALEALCPIAPGAPLCLAHSSDRVADGLEIALKGGQNGNEKYFESIWLGQAA